jgi:hypothetical protein
MNEQEWLQTARNNRDKLVSLLRQYHPASKNPNGRRMSITAVSAENALRAIRRDIKESFKGDPVDKFNKALDNGSFARVYTLLNDAWCGVPESTDCWSVTGFTEAVRLLEDPPGPDYDEEND